MQNGEVGCSRTILVVPEVCNNSEEIIYKGMFNLIICTGPNNKLTTYSVAFLLVLLTFHHFAQRWNGEVYAERCIIETQSRTAKKVV